MNANSIYLGQNISKSDSSASLIMTPNISYTISPPSDVQSKESMTSSDNKWLHRNVLHSNNEKHSVSCSSEIPVQSSVKRKPNLVNADHK